MEMLYMKTVGHGIIKALIVLRILRITGFAPNYLSGILRSTNDTKRESRVVVAIDLPVTQFLGFALKPYVFF